MKTKKQCKDCESYYELLGGYTKCKCGLYAASNNACSKYREKLTPLALVAMRYKVKEKTNVEL